MPHGAAQDSPQNVTSSVVGGNNPVTDEESDGAAVISEDPKRDIGRL
jgi:hypothetical protein